MQQGDKTNIMAVCDDGAIAIGHVYWKTAMKKFHIW